MIIDQVNREISRIIKKDKMTLQEDGAYLQVADVCGLHGPMKHYLQEVAGDLFISPPRTSLQLKSFSKLAQQVTLQVSYSNPLCLVKFYSFVQLTALFYNHFKSSVLVPSFTNLRKNCFERLKCERINHILVSMLSSAAGKKPCLIR